MDGRFPSTVTSKEYVSLYTSETQNNRPILTKPTVTTCKTANNNTIPILSAPSNGEKRNKLMSLWNKSSTSETTAQKQILSTTIKSDTNDSPQTSPPHFYIFHRSKREPCFYIGSVLLMKATPTEPSFDQLPGKRAAKLSKRGRGKGAGLAANTETWVWCGGVAKYEYGHSEKFWITTFQRGLESWVFINVWVKIIFVML